MDVGLLMERGREFLARLPRSGTLLLVADDDTDGVMAAHLFAKYYHRRNPYTSILIAVVDREEAEKILSEERNEHIVFLDMQPPIALERRVYVVDHHPVADIGQNIVMFNPHLYGVPNASRYNTGFLVYLLFKDEIDRGGDLWKVAVSSFGDTSYDYLRPYFYGIDRQLVELASHMAGSVPREKIGLLFSALEESSSIEDFVSNEELLSLKKEFERKLLEILEHIDNYCFVCEEDLKVILLPSYLCRFKSAVATVYSKRNPSVLVAVGCEEENSYAFSLRLQEAYQKKVHLGLLSKELANRWGTRGGGHAPAAGLRIPRNRLKELVNELRRALKEFS